jgi:hypothetical protein
VVVLGPEGSWPLCSLTRALEWLPSSASVASGSLPGGFSGYEPGSWGFVGCVLSWLSREWEREGNGSRYL